ncbi:MAG TPA: serine/threonine-protein kinase [Labilithrix sp.]|nr:serine/threonine-protein kinase [Labilithrix sp.]
MAVGSNRLEQLGRLRDPLVGRMINGRFRVEHPIARGGMGRIYFGRQVPLERPVALKVVSADSREAESHFLKRFLLEASILAKIQHPNVVTFFDYGRIEGSAIETYFIAMEYLDGETLAQRLRTRGALSVRDATAVLRQIARGLREAHVRGVVHRDLKPSNIVLASEGDGEIAKLVDFGVGKLERGGEDLTRNGVLVGTPKYMAPEQFEGVSSAASDVYSLGLVAYQMLVGALPFSGSSVAELMIAKLERPLRSMRNVNPACQVPENIERLVYRMLARRTEERLTLDEILRELTLPEEIVFGSSAGLLAASAAGPRFHTTAARRRLAAGPSRIETGARRKDDASNLIGAAGPTLDADTPPPLEPSRIAGARIKGHRVAIPLVIASVFAVGAIATVGLGFTASRSATGARSSAAPAPPASAPPPRPTSFMLRIDTVPTGAVLTESGHFVGLTPVDVRIDRSSVEASPRTFQLIKDGYTGTSFTQGLAESNVERVVALAPDSGRTKARVPSTVNAVAPAGRQTDLDIRLRR